MIREQSCKTLALYAVALSLYFSLVSFSGLPSSMASGILHFLLICSSLACAFLFGGGWLFFRVKEREQVPVLLGAAVGALFALGASILVVMSYKIGFLFALFALAISLMLCVLLYGGGRLLRAYRRKEKGFLHAVAGGAMLLVVPLLLLLFAVM